MYLSCFFTLFLRPVQLYKGQQGILLLKCKQYNIAYTTKGQAGGKHSSEGRCVSDGEEDMVIL